MGLHRTDCHSEILFLVDEILGFDLFGDPVQHRDSGPGRPAVSWCRENSNKVLLAFARGLSVKDAAAAIGLSAPTLRKVYFSECGKRQQARLRMEMTQLARLNTQAEAGNVAAEKELAKMLDKLRLRDTAQAQAPAPKGTQPVGKKEAAKTVAREAQGLYQPRPSPGHRVN